LAQRSKPVSHSRNTIYGFIHQKFRSCLFVKLIWSHFKHWLDHKISVPRSPTYTCHMGSFANQSVTSIIMHILHQKLTTHTPYKYINMNKTSNFKLQTIIQRLRQIKVTERNMTISHKLCALHWIELTTPGLADTALIRWATAAVDDDDHG